MSESPLSTDVQFLTGVGPSRAPLLHRLGLETAEQLLWYLPRDVLDLSSVCPPEKLEAGVYQAVRGTVVDSDARMLKNGRTMVGVLIDCGSDYCRGVWFNQPWMRKRLQPGQHVLFSGKPKRHQGRWEFSHPQVQWLDEDDTTATPGIIPRYGLTEGLRQIDLHRILRAAVDEYAPLLADQFPEALRKQLGVPSLAEAIRHVHVPENLEQYEQSRRRLLLDDLLEFQLGLALRRRVWRARRGAPQLTTSTKIDARIRRLFPFRFTDGQNQAIREIVSDLESGIAMHRLLQADVGAGKTVVAIYAMLVAIAHGWQATLMAPTELLAVQHWQTIDGILSHSRVSRALLTGSLPAAERRRVIAGIDSGEIQLVVGTQALLQKDVHFPKLGVVVIDEQHKFGVEQRAQFSSPEEAAPPHVLVMTATPIPRSLCLTQFGDLDLSLVRDLPAGRQTVVTSRITGSGARTKAWEFLHRQLQQGRQLYIVCPLVDGANGSGGSDRAAAEQTFQELSQGELAKYRVGLVHGQMNRDQRTETMDAFRDGDLDALVATSVIEVGVDIPNATLMVVMDAERFGLSQLHQLRGRIGRGRHRGYCFLFSESESEDASSRLQAMERTSDGFEIAEMDFELRGPGDVLGTRQHGNLPLRVAHIGRDAALLKEARDVAFDLVRTGEIDTGDYRPLKASVIERFAAILDLPRTG